MMIIIHWIEYLLHEKWDFCAPLRYGLQKYLESLVPPKKRCGRGGYIVFFSTPLPLFIPFEDLGWGEWIDEVL